MPNRFLLVFFVCLTYKLESQSSNMRLNILQRSINQLKDSINANKDNFKHLILFKDSVTVKQLYLDTTNHRAKLELSHIRGACYLWYYQNNSLMILENRVNPKFNYSIYFNNDEPIIFNEGNRRQDLTDLQNFPNIQQAINYGLRALEVFLSPLGYW